MSNVKRTTLRLLRTGYVSTLLQTAERLAEDGISTHILDLNGIRSIKKQL